MKFACSWAFVSVVAFLSISGSAQATLVGRDLGGTAEFDAYYDTELNISWLADTHALGIVTSLAQGRAAVGMLDVFGVAGWRLPKVTPINAAFTFDPNIDVTYNGSFEQGFDITDPGGEISHLYYVTLGNKGYFNTGGVPQSDFGWANAGPFLNIPINLGDPSGPNEVYIYDTVYNGLDFAFYTLTGAQGFVGLDTGGRPWAVHDGDVGEIPEPSKTLLLLAGLGIPLSRSNRRAG